MRKVVFLLVVLVCCAAAFGQDMTQGSLIASDKKGKELGFCPLKTTKVSADISGFLSRVRVRQEFENSFTEAIEAVYVFPLSQNGAVDDMTMTVGDRVIRAKIMKREEARQTYETAKSEGKTASLLDQERPNIFTQSVANIMPGERVVIEISYVETLRYEDGAYEFVFPMTVAPRYVPGGVRDATRIKPPVVATRNGSDISIEVNLNAGVPIEGIRSSSHRIAQVNFTPNTAKVTLGSGKTIPNKDFILRYDVTGKRIEDALLVHRDERGGFFTMILQPPDKIASEDRTPKEIVFVLDTSGSMEGFPIEKAKEAMRLSLDGLYPDDTFNLITFAGDTDILFEKPVPATRANLEKAQAFLAGREGSGGTEMMTAIKAALEPSDAQDHLRIVCFMTDGEVGNDDEIIAEVQKHPKARVFSFGIGESVNRSLLDKIAQEGNGEAEYVALSDDGSKAAKKFYERVRSPLLTDLSIDWNGMPVADIYPNKLSDLFSAKPVTLHGRYTNAASGTIKLKGNIAGAPYERDIPVTLPEKEPANDVLATLWARTRIDDLSSQSLKFSNSGETDKFDAQITSIGLEFRLLTAFTSFVAVEDRVVNQNGKPVTVGVPVILPDGMSPNMAADDEEVIKVDVVGGGGGAVVSGGVLNVRSASNPVSVTRSGKRGARSKNKIAMRKGSGSSVGSGSGQGSTNGNGVGSGYGNSSASVAAPAASVDEVSPPPPVAQGVQASVDVIADTSEIINTTSQTTETVSVQSLQNMPQGMNFTTLLKLQPGTRATGDGQFQIDGASGSENTFIVDGNEVSTDGSNLTGKGVVVVKPTYPAAARTRKAHGEVAVEITTNTIGKVVSAKAVSGDPALRGAAEKAASLTRFAPIIVDGAAIRMSGTIVYNFTTSKQVAVSVKNTKAQPATAEDKRMIAIGSKLHFWLSDLVERLANGVTSPGVNEARFVHGGKAEVQLELTGRSAGVIEKLKQAGFEVVRDNGKTLLTGRIALGKIAAVAEIDEVKLILPKI